MPRKLVLHQKVKEPIRLLANKYVGLGEDRSFFSNMLHDESNILFPFPGSGAKKLSQRRKVPVLDFFFENGGSGIFGD